MTTDPADRTLPDPGQSAAVLIGSSSYTQLPDLSTVRNNLGGLAAILRDPGVWGLSEERCVVIANPARAAELIDPVAAAAEKASDTLLVYYAGHGLTDRAGDLHLTLTDSDAKRTYTQVPFQWVRDPIRDSPARRRVIVLDCCYSGRAANEAMGDDAQYAAQADVDGSFILTATPENREALAPADQQYTAFTQEFIAVLGEGVIGGSALLNLNEVFNHVSARLRSSSRPPPQARDRNNLGSQTSFRNKAFVAGAAQPPVSAERRDAESDTAMQHVRTICIRASADFLRQEKLPAHDRLYVPRQVDRDIESVIGALGPANLRRVHRLTKANRGDTSGDPVLRSAPSQLMVLSDGPGTGKTMLAVQLSRLTATCGALLRHADKPVADDLWQVLQELGPDFGLTALLSARMPLLCVVDGLDQADHAADQRQIIALFKLIDQLNTQARSQHLLAFPIAVLFTIRESEWDRWFTVFEGRNAVEFRRVISRFTLDELNTALDQYSITYDYKLLGEFPAEALDTLAVPLNVRILSESHEYGGQTKAADAFDEHIMAGFVRRRLDLIVRLLPWLTTHQLTAALTGLAMALVEERTGTIPVTHAAYVLEQSAGLARDDATGLLRTLIEERIATHDAHGIRLSHPSLLEYLVAAASVRRMTESGRSDPLEELTSKVAEVSAASSAAVRANVEQIIRTERPDAQQMVSKHYSTSPTYIGSRLVTLRSDLGAGQRTPRHDLDSIYGSIDRMGPEAAWHAFFVVAAVPNGQSAERLIHAFTAAWDANHGKGDRWKLLSKLRQRGLLYREEVVARLLGSSQPRDWETFLGWLIEEQDRERERVLAAIARAIDRPVADLMGDGPEWEQARGLLCVLTENRLYVDGQLWGKVEPGADPHRVPR